MLVWNGSRGVHSSEQTVKSREYICTIYNFA